MSLLSKQLSIAVIGAPSSGKSYLLFDMIHAFHVLGYRPEVLPLNYRYSSFGTFFYDTFNAHTGGMKGTEVYACRPESHYGANLSHSHGSDVDVNFLNIPGEAFRDLEAIKNYFALKVKIERNKGGLFWLATYRAPSGHEVRLVLPSQEFNLSLYPTVPLSSRVRHVEYMRWEHINGLLKDGDYEETGHRKSVSGNYLFTHLTEVLTDSVLLCLREAWPMLTGLDEDLTYYEENVFKHFYALSYCQNATDLIICDNLNAAESAASLSLEVCHYLENLTSHAPNVYMAFRNADLLLGDRIESYRKLLPTTTDAMDVAHRNQAYMAFESDLKTALSAEDGGWIGKEKAEHILLGVGRSNGFAFRELLNMSMTRNKKPLPTTADGDSPLAQHVFFTATPIDSSMELYQNDPSDVTRFVLDKGTVIKSFVRETNLDMSRHGCWGSLQLLQDVLKQNGCLPSSLKDSFPATTTTNNQ